MRAIHSVFKTTMITALIATSCARAETFDPSGWETRNFEGQTQFSAESIDGVPALCGNATGSSSARYMQRKIDLVKNPILRWQWYVQTPLNIADEAGKANDDFSARIYVVFGSALSQLFAKSLNYVWSSGKASGSMWTSPYTSKVKLISVADSSDPTGQWLSFERNVQADIAAAFGKSVTEIQGLAVMVDADNTKSQAASCIANISLGPQ